MVTRLEARWPTTAVCRLSYTRSHVRHSAPEVNLFASRAAVVHQLFWHPHSCLPPTCKQFKTEFQPTMQSMKGKAATAAAAAKEAEGHTSAGGSMGGSERLARLSLYSTPPGHDVALEDFERSAIDRLRGT